MPEEDIIEDPVVEETPEWDFEPEKPDPMKAVMDEITSLKQQLSQKDDFKDEYKEEIASQLRNELTPILEEIARPTAISQVIAQVGKGLGEEAKSYINDFLVNGNYSAAQLKAIAKDKNTMTILRDAAEQRDAKAKKVDKSQAPRSEGAQTVTDEHAASRADIEREARNLAASGLWTYEKALKAVEESSKNAQ